ncbi:tetratricopeptide repeat protein [Cohnella candidum]|uniref:Tetratricopeptide repeat protein n=1 Tax=Cohnella candidum TaxID=2674991 RepID=A0A3G3K4E6_9BACL|nr:tetratricopeptide repeat protein [Cohnella candidum]AYQ75312.1 tetratricopeptide repeat protein [Cohnella candidum]
MKTTPSWSRRLAGLALSLTVAASFTSAIGAIGAAPSAVYAASAQSTDPVSQPVWPVLLYEENDPGRVLPSLREYVAQELKMSKDEASYMEGDPFYEVNLGGMPDGYFRQFLVATYAGEHFYLLLLATDKSVTHIRTLDTVSEDDEGDIIINTAKFDLEVEGSKITLWSQAPYRAFQSDATLEWDGSKLNVLSHEYSDPTDDYFQQKDALLKKSDLTGLMKLEGDGETGVMYPAFYEEYFSLAAPTLQLAYKKSLDAYKKGDAKSAANMLQYGLRQYAEPYGLWEWSTGKLTAADLKTADADFHPEGRLPAATFIPMLNDYGFFLSEAKRYKEAKPILLNVIQLAPTRAVAYLNAADTEWALGDKKNAKAHYQKYLKLLGKNASKAPARVQQRIKAK